MAAILVRPFAPADLAGVEAIFWETSARRNFGSPDERERFRAQYLTSYLRELALVAVRGDAVVGYIVCARQTDPSGAYWSPHLAVFEDLYPRYPAHLHINCTEAVRGLGVGGLLIEELLRQLRLERCPGVHLITLGGARNVSFYLRHGFEHRVERLWNDKPLLLMGQTL